MKHTHRLIEVGHGHDRCGYDRPVYQGTDFDAPASPQEVRCLRELANAVIDELCRHTSQSIVLDETINKMAVALNGVMRQKP